MGEPLYMTSIVIGESLFDSSFVREALFGRAKSLCHESKCPEFQHTSVRFHFSREALEREQSRTKMSTAGQSIVWSPSFEALDGPLVRSISRNAGGFYDVLNGHTGERQGLRCDRPGVRKTSHPNDANSVASMVQTNSWVSPLCKQTMAYDMVHSLAKVLGSEQAVARWLNDGA